MGIIKETVAQADRGYQEALQAANVERAGVISAAVGELGLNQSESFEGDPETALVHCFGEEAFDDEVYDRFIELVERIEEHAEEGNVPVLFVAPTAVDAYGDSLSDRSSLISVDPTNVKFRSDISRREGVNMHAFTDDTAGVTSRWLSLVGQTSSVSGNIFLDPENLTSDEPDEALELYALTEADDGKGNGMPSDYAFRDSETNRLERSSAVLVGWEEITRAFVENHDVRFSSESGRVLVSRGLLIGAMLQKAGYTQAEVRDLAPQLAGYIDNMHTFVPTPAV